MRAALLAILMGSVAIASSQPNIIFVFTDDQDSVLGSMQAMPKTTSLLVDKGVSFSTVSPAVPVCCPSRSSFVTGRYQHNTGVVNNSVAGECGGPAWQAGPETWNFGYLLQSKGYRTQYIGKYLNTAQEPGTGGFAWVPRGWERDAGETIGGWFGLQGNSKYYDYSISNNGTQEKHGSDYATDYFPDLIKNRTVEFIEYAAQKRAVDGRPFFAVAATPSCHQPATPAPQYADSFPGSGAPRVPSYRVEREDTHWFTRTQGVIPMDDNSAAWVDLLARRRLQTLLSVDDLVEAVVNALTAAGQMDNTYIVYTSDHGYHLGNLGMGLDKRQLYETDTRIPFFVRGPGVPEGVSVDAAISTVDLTPTFVDLASGGTPSASLARNGDVAHLLPAAAPPLDGESFLSKLGAAASLLNARHAPAVRQSEAVAVEQDHLFLHSTRNTTVVRLPTAVSAGLFGPSATLRSDIGVEYHGEYDIPPGDICPHLPNTNCYPQEQYDHPPFFPGKPFCSCQDSTNNTYNCIRHDAVVSDDTPTDLPQGYMYCSFVTGFEEFYDVRADPWNLNNTFSSLSSATQSFLRSSLSSFVQCVGESCGRSSISPQIFV